MMQSAVDLLMALTLAILDHLLLNEVFITFLGVAVICCVAGIVISLFNTIGGRG